MSVTYVPSWPTDLALTMDSAASFTGWGKSARNPFVIAVKIALRLTSEGEGMQSMAKCRMKRGVTGLRPPPGGAQAAQRVTSLREGKKEVVHGGWVEGREGGREGWKEGGREGGRKGGGREGGEEGREEGREGGREGGGIRIRRGTINHQITKEQRSEEKT